MNHASMPVHPYTLIPFTPIDRLHIGGRVSRRAATISVEYRLTGTVNDIRVPTPADPPARRHDLWRGTCFELFVKPASQPAYWEFNLTPDGDWNVYHFDAYRQGMREEPGITQPAIEFSSTPRERLLTATLDLPALPLVDGELQVGISSVIENTTGELSYWALKHPAARADFHRHDGLTLTLGAA